MCFLRIPFLIPFSNYLNYVKMFAAAGRIYYPTPGSSVGSFLWRRLFCFANQFVPKFAADDAAIFGFIPGDPVEGNLSPSSG